MNAKTNDTTNALLLDNQLCFALYSANLALNKLYRQLLAPLNLTYPQYLVMLVRLESAGLINRQRSRKDERQVAVTLSDAGRELQQQASGIPHAVGCAAQCDTDTMLALKQQLELLRHQLHHA